MKLEDQVCSLELAKRLKELGVKQESLFVWLDKINGPDGIECVMNPDLDRWYDGQWRSQWTILCSAFTVAELGEMLPCSISYGDVSHEMYIVKEGAWKFKFKGGVVITHTAERGDTEADARAMMLIYLLENKLVTL